MLGWCKGHCGCWSWWRSWTGPWTRGTGRVLWESRHRLKVGIRGGVGALRPGRGVTCCAGVAVQGAWWKWAEQALCFTLKQREGGGASMTWLALCSLKDRDCPSSLKVSQVSLHHKTHP